MNCCFVPLAMLGLVGVTSMDTNSAAVTVSVVEPDTLPNVAAMVVVPTATLVAKPSLPEALDTVATATFVEDQVTVVVRSWVELSE